MRAEFMAFGTTIEVILRNPGRVDTGPALAALGELFQRLHRQWHPWQDGALSELNQALGNGQTATTTPELIRLIQAGQDLERRSSGRFNPAIGGLVSLWGFHTSNYPILDPPPDPSAIERLLAARPSSLDLSINELSVSSSNPAVQLDFSGLAKGLAGQLACQLLGEHEILEALVNLGGDVVICSDQGEAWRVALSNGQGGLLGTIPLQGPAAIFTSGNYYRYGEWRGQRYAHILDPGNGRPVGYILQATVIDRDPLAADAAATALVVGGSLQWSAIRQAMQVDQVLLIDSEGGLAGSPSLIQSVDRSQPVELQGEAIWE